VAWILVHTLDLNHHRLHQEAGQSPSCFRGRQEALPPRDGPTPFPMPSVGVGAPLPDPQLQRGRVQAHDSHDEEALGLLAQGPEVVNELLRMHPCRHPGR